MPSKVFGTLGGERLCRSLTPSSHLQIPQVNILLSKNPSVALAQIHWSSALEMVWEIIDVIGAPCENDLYSSIGLRYGPRVNFFTFLPKSQTLLFCWRIAGRLELMSWATVCGLSVMYKFPSTFFCLGTQKLLAKNICEYWRSGWSFEIQGGKA